jgi:putative Ca2+/H+ antiporter (TMEM165/GDT1 family)
MNGSELCRAYSAVLGAELIADRSVVSVGALATRFRLGAVFAGLVLGSVAKSFVAVMFGHTLKSVPAIVVTILGAATLVWGGFLLLRQASKDTSKTTPTTRTGIGAAFVTVLFSEWIDIGQLTTAFVASHSIDLNAVWLGAALALITKGAVATLIFTSLCRLVPARPMIRVGAAVCFTMAMFALLKVEH